MSTEIRTALPGDLSDIAQLIAREQGDPQHHVAYLGTDVASITTDIESLDDWHACSAVAEQTGKIVGALVPELDTEMGRTWLFGPFVTVEPWDSIADALFAHARTVMPSTIVEEEAVTDARSVPLRAWCERNGLIAEEGSVLLDLSAPAEQMPRDPRVRWMTPADHGEVSRLHDAVFRGTHTTARALVAATDPRAVIELDGRVAGYVAYEVQSDNSGYIDYLAVDPGHRGEGLGEALVKFACADLFERGVANVHLSVRESSAAARALYARVGFIEERIAIPFRKGFSLQR